MEASASAAVCAAIAALGGQVDRDRRPPAGADRSYSCRSRSPPPRPSAATDIPPVTDTTPPQTQTPIDTLLRNVSGHCSDVINNIKMMKMLDITDPDHVKARVGQCLHHTAIATKSLKQIITGIERLRLRAHGGLGLVGLPRRAPHSNNIGSASEGSSRGSRGSTSASTSSTTASTNSTTATASARRATSISSRQCTWRTLPPQGNMPRPQLSDERRDHAHPM